MSLSGDGREPTLPTSFRVSTNPAGLIEAWDLGLHSPRVLQSIEEMRILNGSLADTRLRQNGGISFEVTAPLLTTLSHLVEVRPLPQIVAIGDSSSVALRADYADSSFLSEKDNPELAEYIDDLVGSDHLSWILRSGRRRPGPGILPPSSTW